MSGTGGLLDADYKQDVHHLTALKPSFASEVDVVLCAFDGDRVVGFPVHKAVISQYSPVLSQALQDLFETSRPDKAQHLQRLPMIDDDCSAIRSMLACVYGCCTYTGTPRACKSAPKVSLADSKMIPIHANKMRLPHKYSMTQILVAQEKSLLPALEHLADTPSPARFGQQHALILETAIVAEACRTPQLLAVCEAFVVQNFEAYTKKGPAQISKLSKASLIRIAQTMDSALSETQEALELSASEAQKFIKANFEPGMTCPRCNRQLSLSKKQNIIHQYRSCTWPTDSSDIEGPSLTEIADDLLKLAKAANSARY